MRITHKGTVRWKVEDDSGRVHNINLPNSYYSKDLPFRLLSPQHWGQAERKEDKAKAYCITDAEAVSLCWKNDRYRKTVKLDPNTNVATFWSAPGFNNFKSYCSQHDTPEPVCFPTHLISDNEESYGEDSDEEDSQPDSATLSPKEPAENEGEEMGKQSNISERPAV